MTDISPEMSMHCCYTGCAMQTCVTCGKMYCQNVSLMHGCPPQKKSNLPKLISFSGYAFAGKDAAADKLVEKLGYHKTYMSKPLEQALLAINPWVPTTNFGNQYIVAYATLHAAIGYSDTKKIPEVRRMLQVLGTEIFRDMVGPTALLDIVFKETTELQSQGKNVAITGVRRHNELERVHAHGGISFWIDRPGYGPVNDHVVENEIGPKDCKVIINNDGTLEDLYSKIWAMLLWEGYGE